MDSGVPEEDPMRDGRTRKVDTPERDDSFEGFIAGWRATVVVLSGDAAGTEYTMERPGVSMGRGEEADWTFADDTMSKEHAILEFTGGGIRLRDLGSMNGTRLNGGETRVADLKNGDRFQLGEHEFQFVLEKLSRKPRTYVLPDE
jgi:pSer/pThr/pTyr-binding forkhead associated (FHA) protein